MSSVQGTYARSASEAACGLSKFGKTTRPRRRGPPGEFRKIPVARCGESVFQQRRGEVAWGLPSQKFKNG